MENCRGIIRYRRFRLDKHEDKGPADCIKSPLQKARQSDGSPVLDGSSVLYRMLSNGKKVEEHIIDPAGDIIASRRQAIGSADYFKGYFFYHQDLQNSTTAIVSDQGSRVKRYEYKPYGTMQINKTYPSTKKFINEELYTGHIQDGGTGFYYMNARHYEPSGSRFLTPDSYTGNPYNPNTQNVYTYTGNNPVNYVDPTGHYAIPIGFGIVVGLILLLGAVAIIATSNPVEAPPANFELPNPADDLENMFFVLGTLASVALASDSESNATPAGMESSPSTPGNPLDPNDNKKHHIFDKQQHHLDEYLKSFNGDQNAAFDALQTETQNYITQNNITGNFVQTVNVNGFDIVVKGKVIDGLARIGTAYIPVP